MTGCVCVIPTLISRKHRVKPPFGCIFVQLIIIQGLCFSDTTAMLANVWSPPNAFISPSRNHSDFLSDLFVQRYCVLHFCPCSIQSSF